MNVPFLKKRLININLHPEQEWEKIKGEQGFRFVMKEVVLPLTVVAAILTFVGNLIVIYNYDYSFSYILAKTVVCWVELFFTLFVSGLIVNEIGYKFGIEKNTHTTFKLLAYSFMLFYALTALSGFMANYQTLGKFMRFLGLFGLYPFWIGVGSFYNNLREKQKQVYVAVCLLVVIVVFALLSWSTSFMLRTIYYISIATN